MSPDLIAFLLDALPWLALAITLGYLVGRFSYPQPERQALDDDAASGPHDSLRAVARDAHAAGENRDAPDARDSRRGDRDSNPLQRSAQPLSARRPLGAYVTDADAFARHVERLTASCASPSRAPSPRRDPRSLH